MAGETSTATTGGVPTLDLSKILSGITTKSTTGGGSKIVAWDGQKQVPTTDLKKQWLTLTTAQRQSVVNYAASVGLTAGQAQTVWNKLVDASQASVQAGKPMSPWDVLNQDIKANIPVGAGKVPLVRSAPLSDSVANALAFKTFAQVFGRIPTAEDLSAPSNIKDPNGNVVIDPNTKQPATFARAIQILSQTNKDFADTTTYSYDQQNNVKGVTSSAAVDPSTYLQAQMNAAYANAIASGKQAPQASIQDQYAQLANQYGKNAFDPLTQKITPQAQIDIAQLQAGTKTIDQFKTDWANSVIPTVASAAHQGLLSGAITLQQLAKPAIDRVSSLLEKNPETVTVNDPYVQKYLQGDGKNVMSQAELESTIKSDPNWKFTQNANASLTDLASQILGKFGVNA
jgi:hypothetical protein